MLARSKVVAKTSPNLFSLFLPFVATILGRRNVGGRFLPSWSLNLPLAVMFLGLFTSAIQALILRANPTALTNIR